MAKYILNITQSLWKLTSTGKIRSWELFFFLLNTCSLTLIVLHYYWLYVGKRKYHKTRIREEVPFIFLVHLHWMLTFWILGFMAVYCEYYKWTMSILVNALYIIYQFFFSPHFFWCLWGQETGWASQYHSLMTASQNHGVG